MAEETKETKVPKWLKKVAEKVKDMLSDFVDWFQDEIAPEVMEFAEDNKDTFIKIIKKVAVEACSGREKRDRALALLETEFEDTEGKLTVEKWWIDTALQMIYAALRSNNQVD